MLNADFLEIQFKHSFSFKPLPSGGNRARAQLGKVSIANPVHEIGGIGRIPRGMLLSSIFVTSYHSYL